MCFQVQKNSGILLNYSKTLSNNNKYETMFFKITIKAMVDLSKRFVWAYESLLFGKKESKIHGWQFMKKYSNAFILQKVFHRMTQRVTGTHNVLRIE